MPAHKHSAPRKTKTFKSRGTSTRPTGRFPLHLTGCESFLDNSLARVIRRRELLRACVARMQARAQRDRPFLDRVYCIRAILSTLDRPSFSALDIRPMDHLPEFGYTPPRDDTPYPRSPSSSPYPQNTFEGLDFDFDLAVPQPQRRSSLGGN